MQKKEYSAPELKELGDVREITQASSSGNKLDGDYSAGTPSDGDILTFS